MTGVPPTRFPGSVTTAPPRRPLRESRPDPGTAAGPDPLLHRLSVLDDEHLLEAGEGHHRRGRKHDGGAVGVDHDLGARERAGAKLPALVRHLGLDDQRAVLLLDGRAQAGHAAGVRGGVPSSRTRTACPTRTEGASRSGTATRSRSGWTRTRPNTGAPAARYSPPRRGVPARPRRSARSAPRRPAAAGPGRGSSSARRAVPDGSGSPPGRPDSGSRRPEAWTGTHRPRTGRSNSFRELRRAVPAQARLLEHRPGLAHQRGLLGIDAFARAVSREPQPGAHLAEGASACSTRRRNPSGRGGRGAALSAPGSPGRPRFRSRGRRP